MLLSINRTVTQITSRGEGNMMKNKTKRIIVNGIVLSALAAVGVTVFQLGTSPVKEQAFPEETQFEESLSENEETEEEKITVDAGSNIAQASIEEDNDVENVTSEASVKSNDVESEIQEPELEETTEEVTAAAISLPELNFSEDTLMQWPVNGTILLDYSMDQTTYFSTLDQYRLSPAIAVQAVEGAPVIAATAGKVLSIENDAKTGTTITMELGNGYQAVYGQLKDLTVSEGDIVKEGAIIGYINTPTKYYSTEGSNLYFAMKQNGEPIDPILYLP